MDSEKEECSITKKKAGVTKLIIGIALGIVAFGLIGDFYARLLNYAQTPRCIRNQRYIAQQIQLDAKDHAGHYLKSLRELDYVIPEDRRYCPKYYFYFLHTTSTYVFNGHLAGKEVPDAYPERTILTAEGKRKGMALFYDPSDMDLRNHGSVTFLDGHYARLDRESISTHFPANGTVTKDTWFIQPQEEQSR